MNQKHQEYGLAMTYLRAYNSWSYLQHEPKAPRTWTCHEDEVIGKVRLSQEKEHVQPQERHVLEDGNDYAHGVETDEALDADMVAQVLSSRNVASKRQGTSTKSQRHVTVRGTGND